MRELNLEEAMLEEFTRNVEKLTDNYLMNVITPDKFVEAIDLLKLIFPDYDVLGISTNYMDRFLENKRAQEYEQNEKEKEFVVNNFDFVRDNFEGFLDKTYRNKEQRDLARTLAAELFTKAGFDGTVFLRESQEDGR